MKRFLGVALFVGIFGFIGALLAPSSDASAATITGYGTGYVGSTRYDVTNKAQADSFLAAICGWGGYGHPVAVIGYPSNMSLNESNGRMTYVANIVWRSCANNNASRSFAITGYPDSEPGSLATCPNAGSYAYPQTYDCIKYTLSDGGHLTGYSTLNCPGGTGYRCVTGGSSPSGLFRSVIERIEKLPATSPQLSQQVMGGTVPNWSTATLKSGSFPFDRAGAFCTFYKHNSNGASGYANCTALRINVSWTRYDYSLVPTIKDVTDGSALEVPNANLRVTGSVRNNGPTESRPNLDWRLTKIRYDRNAAVPQKAGGTSVQGTLPCAYFTGEAACDTVVSGTRSYPANDVVDHPGTTNVDDYPVGTRICFAMSVRQYTHTTENWRHSALSCYVVGKKPKVNILGGDLFVGRTVAGATSPISTKVVTSTSRNSTGTYGSWGEYALVSSGAVSGMASGSGYVDGSSAYSNLLTFVNSGNTSARCATANGCYTHASTVPDVGARFKTGSSTPVLSSIGSLSGRDKGVYKAPTFTTILQSTIGAGKWIVINAPNANVTIAGNIRYANGPFANASQIPQLVIIANSITINENVEQVDAWLVAPGTVSGGAVSGGVIRTCNRSPATISEGNCDRILTVNGPVIANRLLMLRTGGAEENESRGDPAEIFNFRPDAYIWAAQQAESGGRVTTVSTKELPPRY